MVTFTVTLTVLSDSGGPRPGGAAEVSVEDKLLVFTLAKGPKVEVPFANIKKLGPMPKSTKAIAIHLDVFGVKGVGQLKIVCKDTPTLQELYTFLTHYIEVAEPKKKFLKNSTHIMKVAAVSPASKLKQNRVHNVSSRPGSSLASNTPYTQPTQVTSPRVSGTLTSASKQQSVPLATKSPRLHQLADNTTHVITDSRGGGLVLGATQVFKGRQSHSQMRPIQGNLANPTTPSSSRSLHIKPRERAKSPDYVTQRLARKRTISAAEQQLERSHREEEHDLNGNPWTDERDYDDAIGVPANSPNRAEEPKRTMLGNVSPAKEEDHNVPELIDLEEEEDKKESYDVFVGGPFSYRGMKNLGNSCYMNASLQALASSPDFIRRLLCAYRNQPEEADPPVANSALLRCLGMVYNRLFAPTAHERRANGRLYQDTDKNITKLMLEKLRSAAGEQLNPEFATTSQQDAHEFMFMLLDHIKDEIDAKFGRPSGSPSSDKENGPPLHAINETDDFQKPVPEDSKDKIHTPGDELECFMAKYPALERAPLNRNPADLFGFKCVAKNGCDRCGKSNDRVEGSTDFQLGIREGDWSIKSLMVSQFAREQLDGYACEECKDVGPGFMTTAFRELPENLIVVLKRYNYDRDTMRFTKCRQEITVERELMLKELCEDSEEKRLESAARVRVSTSADLNQLSSNLTGAVHVTPPSAAERMKNNQGFSPIKGLPQSPWKNRRQSAQISQQSRDLFGPTQDSTKDIFDSQNGNNDDDDSGVEAPEEECGVEEEDDDVSMELGEIGADDHVPDATSPLPTAEEQPAIRQSSSPEDAAGLCQTGGGTADNMPRHLNVAEVPEDPVPRRSDSDGDSVVVTAQSPSSKKTVEWRPLTAKAILDIQHIVDFDLGTTIKQIERWRQESLCVRLDTMPQTGQRPREVDMGADGNCLFRGISWYLFNGDQNHHDSVRARVIAFMEKLKEQFQSHVKYADGIDTYLTFKKQDGDWGTDVEIHAMATMFRCVIFSFFKGRWTMFKPLFTYDAHEAGKFYVTEEEEMDWERMVEEKGAIYIINDDNTHFNVVSGPILGEENEGIPATTLMDEEEDHLNYDELDFCKPSSPSAAVDNYNADNYDPDAFLNEALVQLEDYGTSTPTPRPPSNMDVDAAPPAPTYEFKDEDDPVYTLTAVVNHHGESLRYGHYTCYSFDSQRNIWLDCNDSCIAKIEESEVLQEAGRHGYMFVYRRRHTGDTAQFKPSTHDYN